MDGSVTSGVQDCGAVRYLLVSQLGLSVFGRELCQLSVCAGVVSVAGLSCIVGVVLCEGGVAVFFGVRAHTMRGRAGDIVLTCALYLRGLQWYAKKLILMLIEQSHQLLTRQISTLQPYNLRQRVLPIPIPRQMQHPLRLTPLTPITTQPATLTFRARIPAFATPVQQHCVELVDDATLECPHQLLHEVLLAGCGEAAEVLGERAWWVE